MSDAKPKIEPTEWQREIIDKHSSEHLSGRCTVGHAIFLAMAAQREEDAKIAENTTQRLRKLGRKERRLIEADEFYEEIGSAIRKGGK